MRTIVTSSLKRSSSQLVSTSAKLAPWNLVITVAVEVEAAEAVDTVAVVEAVAEADMVAEDAAEEVVVMKVAEVEDAVGDAVNKLTSPQWTYLAYQIRSISRI